MSNSSRGPTLAIVGAMSRYLTLAALLLLFAADAGAVRPAGQPGVDWGAPEGQECVDCHMSENPGLYLEWNHSQHGQNGVTCLDCHQAEESDIDAFRHEEQFISIVVTPKDCSKCHQTEFEQMDGSHHAKAGQILGSLDNLLGEVIGGPAAVNAGCKQCH
ncbi:MAG: multiheme c-type cytochrome, partial [Thiohalocapsa sp.]